MLVFFLKGGILCQFFVRRGRGSHVNFLFEEGVSRINFFVQREKGSHVNFLFEGEGDLISIFSI